MRLGSGVVTPACPAAPAAVVALTASATRSSSALAYCTSRLYRRRANGAYPPAMTRRRAALAGAAAATVWAALQPLDRRVFGCEYSDVAVLGKAVTRSRLWP